MVDRVISIKARAVIELGDNVGTEIELVVSDQMNYDNYIRGITINEELNAVNQNPVGVVSSNNIKIDIRSMDKALIPENNKSVYYGYMNDTAKVTLYLEDKDGEFLFGVWYVEKWYSSVTSDDPYKVTIEAYDIMSYIFNSNVPNINISDSTSIKDYFIDVINGVNEINDNRHQIEYDSSDIVFDEFKYMQFSNLNTDNISNLFNTISQSTLTNIYIDIRDNKLKTDYCGDDRASESKGNFSDTINIIRAAVDSSGLVAYSGARVYYTLGVVNNVSKLVELREQTIDVGDNSFYNISLGENSVYRINYVDITTNEKAVIYTKSFKYSKNTIDLEVTSDTKTSCDINIYGQTINESELFKERFRAIGDKSGSVLKINNKIIPANDIDKYIGELIRLMDIRDGSISVVGWINPRIGISSTVDVDLDKSISISGLYKTNKMVWSITSSIKCNASLVKTITV